MHNNIELTVKDVSNNNINKNVVKNTVNDMINTVVNNYSDEEYNIESYSHISSSDENYKPTIKFKKFVTTKDNVVINVRDLDSCADEIIDCGYNIGKYNKVTYKQVNDKINNLYFEQNEYYSSAMDILSTYVKGQKLIYMEAMHYSNRRLDKLMLPSIFLTASASVASIGLDTTTWGSIFLSALNAFCVLSFIHFPL